MPISKKPSSDYVAKIKENRLELADLEGGTFSISNGGIYGSLLSTPILNTPQSAILGMHRIEKRPVAINDQVVIRPMMYVALSYDHPRCGRPRGSDIFKARQRPGGKTPSDCYWRYNHETIPKPWTLIIIGSGPGRLCGGRTRSPNWD